MIGRFTARNQVAIAGYAHSAVERHAARPLGALTIDTARQAIADAGLDLRQVDGVVTAALFPTAGSHTVDDGVSTVTAAWLAEHLGIEPRYVAGFQGIGQVTGAVALAVNAIASGAADHVLMYRSLHNPPGRYHANPMGEAPGPRQWTVPQGYFGPLSMIALPYNEYLHRFGASREAMAAVVVEARKNGARIPWSYWYEKPLTADEYLAAPTIVDPVCRYDCDIPVDGAAAFVFTSAERARDLPHRPVYVAGYANGVPRTRRLPSHWPLDDIMSVGAATARRLWEHAGVGPAEVDLPQLYDGFSPFVWFWLEALGFCPVGEAHRFVLDGRIDSDRPDGLPVLSGGGALGGGRMHGIPQMLECYLQLAGRAGERQRSQATIGVACQSSPHYGGAVVYSAEAFGRRQAVFGHDRRDRSVVPVIPQRCSYIGGKWDEEEEVFPVANPADESHVVDISAASPAAVERAITEARRSFDSGIWADIPPRERARVLHAFLDHIEASGPALIATMVAEAGQPVSFAERTQLGGGLSLARNTIDLYLSMRHEESNQVPVDELVRAGATLSIRRYEPVGVVAAITPYNAAIIMAMQKVVPALLAGNSVVLRPSPLTPLSSLVFGAAAEAVGLPPGVLSVVVESGSAGAELLSTHPAVDMVSFTGSTAIGRQILAQAAPTVKRVALELGGKSAQIYLHDAVDRAARGALAVVATTAGQACVAATRMLVPQDRKDEVVEAVSRAYSAIKVGSPTDPTTLMGPVISAAQRARCERYVALAHDNGAKIAFGGQRPTGFEHGYYFEPTVLDLPDNANPAARDEIFGPVIGIIGYRDLDDAVRIANDSDYGLSGQVYGADVAAATSVARRLRTGAVNVNATVFSAYAPGGGYKQSGLGRERGTEGIRAFQEVKHLAIGDLR